MVHALSSTIDTYISNSRHLGALSCQPARREVSVVGPMALLLDLDLARRITEGIVGVLSRMSPDAEAPPDDPAAREFSERLRRRDIREVVYLRELAAEPRWPAAWNPDDWNHERVFLRVLTERSRVEYAVAVFTGSLVHWESATADPDGRVLYTAMDPDRHWSLKLEPAETVLREMGLTTIPPAAMDLRFGRWTLRALLDPRARTLRTAGEEVARIAASIRETRGVRSPAQAYYRVLDLLRLGYDLGTLADALEGRTPESLTELSAWLSERDPPFAWTRA